MAKSCQLFLIVSLSLFLGCASEGPRFYDSALNDHNRAPSSLGVPTEFENEKTPSVDNVHNQAEADLLFLKSDLESQSGKSSESIELLKSALVYDPQAPTLMQKLAVEYYKKGQNRDAVYWAEKAKSLSTDKRDLILLLAGLYTSTHQYQKAEQEYFSLIKKNPQDAEAILYLGAVYSEMKNYTKAIQKFKELTRQEQYPSKYLAHYYMARVYLEQAAKGSNKLAQAELRTSIKLKSDFFESVSLLGQLIQKEKGADKAFQFYVDFQKKNGPQPKVAEILSQYYIEKNQYDLAYEQLEILDAYSEDLLQVKLKMALILIDKKKYDLAIKKLQEIIVQAPESDKVRFYLSAVYEEKKQFQNAFDEYMKITQQSSYFEEARLHAAYLSKLNGQNDVAMKVLKESISVKTENPQSLFLMAQLLEDRKELNKALETLNLAQNKFPKNAQVLFYKGSLQDKMNLKSEMIESMKKVLEIEQDHVQAMNYLAFSWAEMNTELDQAEKYARKAVSKERSDAFILDTLGWVLYKKGQFKEASEVLEKAHLLQPSVGIIAEHLGDVYTKVQKFDKAKDFFQKAVENETDLTKKKDLEQKLTSVEKNLKTRKPASDASDVNKAESP